MTVRKIIVLGIVVVAFVAAPSASAVSTPLSCTFERGTTSCTRKSFAAGPLAQFRCQGGIFSTRSGLMWTEVVWTYSGNAARTLDGLHPSFAPHSDEMDPHLFPGVRFQGEASSEVVQWDPWQSFSAEDSASTCAGGDFLFP